MIMYVLLWLTNMQLIKMSLYDSNLSGYCNGQKVLHAWCVIELQISLIIIL